MAFIGPLPTLKYDVICANTIILYFALSFIYLSKISVFENCMPENFSKIKNVNIEVYENSKVDRNHT